MQGVSDPDLNVASDSRTPYLQDLPVPLSTGTD